MKSACIPIKRLINRSRQYHHSLEITNRICHSLLLFVRKPIISERSRVTINLDDNRIFFFLPPVHMPHLIVNHWGYNGFSMLFFACRNAEFKLSFVKVFFIYLSYRNRIDWSWGFNSGINRALRAFMPRSICKMLCKELHVDRNSYVRCRVDVDGC